MNCKHLQNTGEMSNSQKEFIKEKLCNTSPHILLWQNNSSWEGDEPGDVICLDK